MSRPYRLLLLLALLASASPAWGRPALPMIDPRVEPLAGPAFRADRFELRLRPGAARAAHAFVQGLDRGTATQPHATARPGRHARLASLGVTSIDRLAASLGGVTFAPEFAGESPPSSPGATDFTAFYLATVPVGVSLERALESFAALEDVASADPIAVLPVSVMPYDSLWSQSWWYYNPPDRQDIHAPEAWNITTGDSSVVVAIIDTGVLFDHPDLGGTIAGSRGQIWTNAAEASGLPGVDDDGGGYVDDVHGWDFVDTTAFNIPPGEDWGDEDNDPNDYAGHGTLVAGLVGAITNNGIGTAGVSWNVRLMPLRIGWATFTASLGLVDMSYAAQAIRYATRMGAHVLNCSFGTQFTTGLYEAAAEATRAGALIVVAAGNDNDPYIDLALRDYVLAVAASTRTDAIASISNRGDYVDLAAPGEDVASTFVAHAGSDSLGSRTPGYYVGVSGTSLAAPLASGTAALVIAHRRATSARPLNAMELLLRLRETADDIAAANPGLTGYGEGRLNAERALAEPSLSFATRAGATTIGAPAVLRAAFGSTPSIYATSDCNLLYLDATGDTAARVALPGRPVGSPAAADLGPGLGAAVFVATSDGRVAGFDGFGAAIPGWPVAMPTSADTISAGPSLGDVDGDGALEVVCVSAGGDIHAWRANGTPLPNFPVATAGAVPAAAAPGLSDLDGASGAEIIAATTDNRVHVVTKTGGVLPGWPKGVSPGLRAPIVMRLGHAPDARVVIALATTLRAFTAGGAIVFSKPLGGSAAGDPLACDLDGDGSDEIVVPLDGAVAAFDSTGTPLPGWPRALASPSPPSGPPVARCIGPPGAGASTVIVPVSGKHVALAADGRILTSYPKPGFSASFGSLADLGGTAGEHLLAGAGADSAVYSYRPPFADVAADSAASWPTAGGNFARSGSRLYAPPMGVIDDVPARVPDLTATPAGATSVALRWTATGEHGRTGRPAAYDVRAALQPIISDSGFVSAPHALVADATVDAGGTETVAFGGLETGTTYWLALRARDGLGKASPLSNTVSGTTGSVLPRGASIAILSLSQPASRPVTLAWRGRAGIPGQRIAIHDVSGRRRLVIDVGSVAGGTAVWDGRDASGERVESGVYFVRLTSGGDHAGTRIVLLQ